MNRYSGPQLNKSRIGTTSRFVKSHLFQCEYGIYVSCKRGSSQGSLQGSSLFLYKLNLIVFSYQGKRKMPLCLTKFYPPSVFLTFWRHCIDTLVQARPRMKGIVMWTELLTNCPTDLIVCSLMFLSRPVQRVLNLLAANSMKSMDICVMSPTQMKV